MARPRPMQRGGRRRIVQARILVHDFDGDGRTDGLAQPHAAQEFRMICLNFLPPPASVPALAASQFTINERRIDRHTFRQAFDQRDQCFAMRFARRAEKQSFHAGRILSYQCHPVPVPLNARFGAGSLDPLSFYPRPASRLC